MNPKRKIFFINVIISLYSLFNRQRNKSVLTKNIEFKRIAIYSTTALGDLLFNTPAIKAIKKRFPQGKVFFVTSQKNITLVKGSTWFYQVEVWDNKIKNIHKILKKLWVFKPEITFILHANIYYDVLCAKISGSTYIVRDNFANSPTSLNRWLDHYSKSENTHIIHRKLRMIEYLGCDTTDIRMEFPINIAIPPKPTNKCLIGFQMGASKPERCWPVQCFIELATLILAADKNTDIILTGTQKDIKLEQDFLKVLPEELKKKVISLVGKTSLVQLIQQIGTFTLLITGDTGPLQIAITVQTPTISLYIGANPRHTGPYQDLHLHKTICIETQEDDDKSLPLWKISAESVFAQMQLLLQR
ncbi:glycosyltransferase family 9 protein [Pantoea sp. Nvir]|nr:glycosyltransferase family 9 protein [Pantoea sp. Nvir]